MFSCHVMLKMAIYFVASALKETAIPETRLAVLFKLDALRQGKCIRAIDSTKYNECKLLPSGSAHVLLP